MMLKTEATALSLLLQPLVEHPVSAAWPPMVIDLKDLAGLGLYHIVVAMPTQVPGVPKVWATLHVPDSGDVVLYVVPDEGRRRARLCSKEDGDLLADELAPQQYILL